MTANHDLEDETDSDWIDGMEEVAVRAADLLASMSEEEQHRCVRYAMKHSRVVYAIWYTDDERHCYCIKGGNIPEGTKVRPAAFIVAGVEDALAMKSNWGDGPTPVH